MRKERNDVTCANFIKGDDGKIKAKEKDILRMWQDHTEQLLNQENDSLAERVEVTEGPVEQIRVDEVRKIFKKIKNGQAAGPTQVSVDLIKTDGDACVDELTAISRKVADEERAPGD